MLSNTTPAKERRDPRGRPLIRRVDAPASEAWSAGMMATMTERGLPNVDEALACPFVAFEGDRDARATGPDHRHRCYAEVRPAPRALAHQQAYCLSSAFSVCPTFQDWARREAARARPGADPPAPPFAVEPPPAALDDMDDRIPDVQRNPPRAWASPPPWMGPGAEPDDPDLDDAPDVQAIPARGGGLAGSFADRMVTGGAPDEDGRADGRQASRPDPRDGDSTAPDVPPAPMPLMPSSVALPSSVTDAAVESDEIRGSGHRGGRGAPGRKGRSADRPERRIAPAWERPPRREAYPTIKTRMGLSGRSLPPLFLPFVALVVAALALLVLPTVLGLGNPPQPSGSPIGSAGASGAAASASLTPTSIPEPTAQVYVVQVGDTMSGIANRFGVPLQTLIDANKATIPNPDNIALGQQVIIPPTAPTTVPGASPSPIPAASASP